MNQEVGIKPPANLGAGLGYVLSTESSEPHMERGKVQGPTSGSPESSGTPKTSSSWSGKERQRPLGLSGQRGLLGRGGRGNISNEGPRCLPDQLSTVAQGMSPGSSSCTSTM
jgi:hypothetical protein